MSLLIRDARVLTLTAGERPRRGRRLGELSTLARADVLIEGNRIVAVSESGISTFKAPDETIDAAGRVLMPAFVDCHTHACWAGDRLDEWERKLRGESYLDIMKSGGGIMSTVRAVRAADEHELAASLADRLSLMEQEGTLAAEVKSGYGLATADELKLLRAVRACADRGFDVVPTALLGHAIDAQQPEFVDRTISETLPAVTTEFPGIPVDAFCEQGAWTLADTVRLLEAARSAGHPVRVHADQFTSLGMIPEAVRLGALSVDHLEASTPQDLRLLAASTTFGVILPCCGLHTDGRYANVRGFVDAGGALALATNCNPGSAPTHSMPVAVGLAVRHCGITPGEAIAACTVNAATLLGRPDRGTIAPGQRADLLLLRHRDERLLAYEIGGRHCDAVIRSGVVVHRAPAAGAGRVS